MKNKFVNFSATKISLHLLKEIKGGLMQDDDFASCSVTCSNGTKCEIQDVHACSTTHNAAAGSQCLSYMKRDGTTGTMNCPS
jgi:hypothetical protein